MPGFSRYGAVHAGTDCPVPSRAEQVVTSCRAGIRTPASGLSPGAVAAQPQRRYLASPGLQGMSPAHRSPVSGRWVRAGRSCYLVLPPVCLGSSPGLGRAPFFAWAEPRRACQLGMAASVTLDGFEPPSSHREAGALSRVSYSVPRLLRARASVSGEVSIRPAVSSWSGPRRSFARPEGVTIPSHAPRTSTQPTPSLLRHHLVSRSVARSRALVRRPIRIP